MIALEPLVTIGIPTYNRADKYLKEALQSALDQTYDNVEIIVADNCSTDHTEAIVNEYVDERIQYYKHSKNIGPNNNFNFLLNQADGHYFLLLQDDDLIDNDFIETCIKTADFSTDFGIIRSGTRIVDASGSVISLHPNMAQGLSTENLFLAWFENKTNFFLCSTVYNTEKFKEIGGFQSRTNLFQDVVATVQLASYFGRIDVPKIMASFRKHEGEMTFSARVEDWCEDSLFLLDIMCKLATDNRERIKSEGMRFFTKLNYRRAARIPSLLKRLRIFFVVFKKFNYQYSPMRYVGVRYVLRPLRRRIRKGT